MYWFIMKNIKMYGFRYYAPFNPDKGEMTTKKVFSTKIQNM